MGTPDLTIIINRTKDIDVNFNIKEIVEKICATKGLKSGYLEFNFISNDEIKKINIEHLDHHYETDIITFNLSENGELHGDIYISIDEAKKNAKEYNSTYHNEIKLLLIHGILHLLNYNDNNEKNKKIMRSEEKRVINLIDV